MNRRNSIILPDALPFAGVGLIITALVHIIFGSVWAVIPAFFSIFTMYFFRNPKRKVDAGPYDVISPADGVILSVEKVHEDKYLKGPAIKVSIFLSIFNVHVNRSPIAGLVEYVLYRPGRFFPAFKSHASNLNERNYVGIRSEKNPDLALMVVQITGFIARRIVCWVKEGDKMTPGERFGLIKYGSCTEIYLPKNSEINVQKGTKVKGGKTIIGRLSNEHEKANS